MAVQLVKSGSEFHALTGGWEDGSIVKAAGGFRWNPAKKIWWTQDKLAAERLARFAEPDLKAELEGATKAAREKAEVAIIASRATDADVTIPCPDGLSYLGYQKAGIAFSNRQFLLGEVAGVLIADDMGLGKTIQAIGIFNMDPAIRRVLIICPASLKLNWKREFEKWATRPVTVALATTAKWPADADVVIFNYDIAMKLRPQIDATAWDLLVFDESHALKNPKAQRTIAVLGGTLPPNSVQKAEARATGKRPVGTKVEPINAKRRVALTGTPILNRPIELWPLVEALDPTDLGRSFMGFAKRYCNAERGSFGWDFSGASNLDELQNKLRARFMVRRLKADVLAELPPKRRMLVEIAANGASAIVAKERSRLDEIEQAVHDAQAEAALAEAAGDRAGYDSAVRRMKDFQGVVFQEMSKLRHATAVAKIPYVIDHLRDAIESSGKVITFAHHIDVIDAIKAEFGDAAVVVTGQTPIAARQAAVDRFQTDPTCTLFIGNILAAGVGLTLTASSHVIFAELDWRPGIVTQAEDRAHRIGQKNMVFVQHLVFEGSIDARMAKTILEKQAVIDSALDNDAGTAGLPEEVSIDFDGLIAQADKAQESRTITAAEALSRLLNKGVERDVLADVVAREDWKRLRGLVKQHLSWAFLTEEEDMPRVLPDGEATQAEYRAAERNRQNAEWLERQEKANKEAAALTPAHVAAIHQALQIVAGVCDGAFQRDGQGFSGADTKIGHTLANLHSLTPRQALLGRKVVGKYVRQYGPDLKAEMGL